jgi:CDP-4-dehydro-6-deoxyglucose reductase
LPPDAIFDFIAGQYIDLIGPNGVRRSYSLANAPRADKTLELHIREVETGVLSQYWFQDANINDVLRLNGPMGTFSLRNVAQRDLVFLATGTGFAPVKAMLESLTNFSVEEKPKSVTVLWGGRYQHDLYFDVMTLPGNVTYIPVLSRETTWPGEQGYVQDIFLRKHSNLSNCVVYACGSDAMIRSAKDLLIAAGLPDRHFYSDAFVCSGTMTSH